MLCTVDHIVIHTSHSLTVRDIPVTCWDKTCICCLQHCAIPFLWSHTVNCFIGELLNIIKDYCQVVSCLRKIVVVTGNGDNSGVIILDSFYLGQMGYVFASVCLSAGSCGKLWMNFCEILEKRLILAVICLDLKINSLDNLICHLGLHTMSISELTIAAKVELAIIHCCYASW